jgi:signal transduction histidine kinase/HAMP domain-containing protein
LARTLRLRTRIALTALTTTAIALAGGAFLTVRFFGKALRDAAIESTEGDIEELRVVVQEDMIASHPGSMKALVSQIARGPAVAWVGIADEDGVIRISSDGRPLTHGPLRSERFPEGGRFAEGSPERQKLEQWQRDGAARSHAYVSDGCGVLRVMAPIENTSSCWACHDRAKPVDGMLIIDRSLKPLQRTVAVATTRLALGGVAALVLALGCIGFVVERTILRRLDRLRRAARRLGRGELSARAGDGCGDELGEVAREFDGMAFRLESAMGELSAQRGQLARLVNGISDGVVLVDTQLRFVTMNQAFAARLGGEPPRPGAPYRELVDAAGLEAEAGPLPAERALSSGKLEKAVVRLRGGERFEELYAQPLLGPDGAATAVIEVWRDITDRKVLEASVEQSERLASLGVLASSVAHEVGNPLASIITAVDGLLARLPERSGESQDEIRAYLELVRKQVFRCHGATERLLGFARVPAAGEDTVVDVAAAARDVAALVAPQAAKQRVALEIRAPGPALAVAPDGAVEQVFLNLTLNALKAMPSGGTLRIDVEAAERAVRVVVADSGPGIALDVAKHLFEPFRTSRREGRGTGLGLFISQALVQRAGGSIEVESVEGRGATFLVRLRRAETEAGRAKHDGAEASS